MINKEDFNRVKEICSELNEIKKRNNLYGIETFDTGSTDTPMFVLIDLKTAKRYVEFANGDYKNRSHEEFMMENKLT